MWKKIVFYTLLAYTLIGFVVVPLILKPQIINLVAKETNAKLSIDSIFFNPYAFYINISGVELHDADAKELVSIKEIHLNVELYSLINSAVHVKNFILEEPKISLVLDKNKKVNFATILKEKEKQNEENNTTTKPPRIILDNIAVIKGAMHYEDYSQGNKFELDLDTIGFELKNIDTNDFNSSDAKIRFYTLLSDGGFIDFKSEVVGFEPFVIKGSVGFEASKLYTQWRYVQKYLNMEVADGKLSFDANYHIDFDKPSDAKISSFNLNLDRLRIKPKGNHKDILGLHSLYVENATILPMQQKVHIAKVGLDGLDISAKRDAKGVVDWQNYTKLNLEEQVAQESSSEITESNTTKKVDPWSVVVDAIALEKIAVAFDDKAIKPSLKNNVNELNIFASNVTLDGREPFDYELDLRVNDTFRCEAKGSVVHKVLDVRSSMKCSDLDVAYFTPYIDTIARQELDVYNVKLQSLLLGFDANLSAQDVNETLSIRLKDTNIHLDKLVLKERATNKRVLSFSDFDITGIGVDTLSKDVNITDATLKYLSLQTARNDDESISVENLVVPKKVKANKKTTSKRKAKKEKEYRVRLKKFALKGAKVGFKDKMLTPSVDSKLDRIYLSVYNVDSKKRTWLSYYLSARLNNSAKIKANGSLRHTPLKQKGKLEISKVALKHINPYIDQYAHVYLGDGYLNFKAKTKYAPSAKSPDLSVNGSFSIDDLFVHDSRDASTLLSFNKLNLKTFTLETLPNRLFVNEVDIDSFYVNALIDANKTMNLATLMKESDLNSTHEGNTTAKVDENLTIAEKKDPFPVKIMKVNIKDGSAIFSDASLPINFKTNIHTLNGQVYAISSNPNETSYVDITGEIDKYGSTKLKGSVNASNPKAFTDLVFDFKNLDLSAMSGYSATFAGYKIDDGKLFLNLNYDIKESQLSGENNIMIKKIKLGDELSVEGGNSLPLGFVIALLEDSDGVIDIDMPVRGNVDKPDFKYGALIWKTLGNLILKAVASPFTFLGSLLGIDGESLEYAEFEPGSLIISPPEREKLDNVAKLLIKRPKMKLSVGGTYNTASDRASLQKSKLVDLVVKLSGAKNEKEKINAMNIDLLEDIYEDARDDEKIEKIKDALEEKYDDDEQFERVYLNALIEECSNIQEVTSEELQKLAQDRSAMIKSYLVDTKGVEVNRVQESEIKDVEVEENRLIKSKLELIVK